MSQNTISSVILRFTLDESAQRRVIKGIGDVEQVLSQTKRQAISVENAAAGMNAEFAELARAKAIENLTADAIRAGAATDDWGASLKYVAEQLSAIGASDDEIKQVARSLASAQTARAGGGGSQRGTSALDRIDRFGSTGSQILSGLGQGEAANAAGLIGDVASGFSSLNPAMIAITAATVAFTVVVGNAVNETKKVTEATRQRFAAERDAAEFLAQSTREQTQQRIADIQRQLTTENEIFAQLQAERNRMLDEMSAFDEARAAIGVAYGELPATTEAADASVAKIAQLTQTLVLLTEGLSSNETAAIDAAEAERLLAEERQKSTNDAFASLMSADQMTAPQRSDQIDTNNRSIQLLEQQRAALEAQGASTDEVTARIAQLAQENEILASITWSLADAKDAEAQASNRMLQATQFAMQADNMTAEQREARITAIQAEVAQYTALLDSGKLSAEATKTVTDKIANLTIEQIQLASVTESAADKLAKQIALDKARSEQTDAYLDTLEDEIAAQEALTKARQQAQADADEYTKKAREISQEADDRAKEIAQEGADKRAEIERKAQETIAKIMRDFGRTNATAIAERDALAAYQAKIRRDDDLEDEGKARDDAIKEQDKAQAKALDSLKASIQKQARALDDSYARQQQITAAAIARAQVDLTNAKYAENAIAMSGANSQRVIHGDMWNSLFTLGTNYATAIVNAVEFIFGTSSGATKTGGSIGGSKLMSYSVNQAVDYRLNQYFQAAGITER